VAVGDNEVSSFFCCLNVAERTVLRQTAESLVLTLGLGVPVTLWVVFWAVTSHDNDAYRLAFRLAYHLEIATIDEGGSPVEVVRPRAGWGDLWADITLYIVSPAGACLGGCSQSKVSPP